MREIAIQLPLICVINFANKPIIPIFCFIWSSLLTTVPLELPIVTREHFNRWYSIKAYYFALTFADLPIQIICVTIFVAITYLMTAQPLEMFRILLFYVIICLVTLISQGWGMITGAVFGTKVSARHLSAPSPYRSKTNSHFSFSVGTNLRAVRHCAVFSIFWIFSTLRRCPSIAALAVPDFLFEARTGGCDARHFRLWSTENGMRTHLLPISNTKKIYEINWYAQWWYENCVHCINSHLLVITSYSLFHYVISHQEEMNAICDAFTSFKRIYVNRNTKYGWGWVGSS